MRYPQGVTRTVPIDQLVGIKEIAERSGKRYQTVQNWLARDIGFPSPVLTLSMGKLWDWREVAAWMAVPRPVGKHRT